MVGNRSEHAVTSEAAWQNLKKTPKGTIEVGKLADFAVLERNIRTVDAGDIRQTRIL